MMIISCCPSIWRWNKFAKIWVTYCITLLKSVKNNVLDKENEFLYFFNKKLYLKLFYKGYLDCD